MGNLKERLESGELELPTELEARDDATAALDLVSRIRMALNDNGKRMQDELLIYCRELAALPARVAALEEVRHALYLEGAAVAKERDRYRYALDRITCEPPAYGADMLMIARDALKTRE